MTAHQKIVVALRSRSLKFWNLKWLTNLNLLHWCPIGSLLSGITKSRDSRFSPLELPPHCTNCTPKLISTLPYELLVQIGNLINLMADDWTLATNNYSNSFLAHPNLSIFYYRSCDNIIKFRTNSTIFGFFVQSLAIRLIRIPIPLWHCPLKLFPTWSRFDGEFS